MAGDYNQLEGVLEVPLTGRTLKLSRRVTNRIKARFEDWLEREARLPIFRMKKDLTVEQYREAMDSISRISPTQLKWGGPVFEESMQNLVGITKFIALLAEAAGEKVGPGDVLALMQDAHDAEALVGSFKEILEDNRKANFLDPPDRRAVEAEE